MFNSPSVALLCTEDTYWEEAMGSVAKDAVVLGGDGGAALPDHLHLAKPGLQGSLHVLVAPLLDRRPLPSACKPIILIRP